MSTVLKQSNPQAVWKGLLTDYNHKHRREMTPLCLEDNASLGPKSPPKSTILLSGEKDDIDGSVESEADGSDVPVVGKSHKRARVSRSSSAQTHTSNDDEGEAKADSSDSDVPSPAARKKQCLDSDEDNESNPGSDSTSTPAESIETGVGRGSDSAVEDGAPEASMEVDTEDVRSTAGLCHTEGTEEMDVRIQIFI